MLIYLASILSFKLLKPLKLALLSNRATFWTYSLLPNIDLISQTNKISPNKPSHTPHPKIFYCTFLCFLEKSFPSFYFPIRLHSPPSLSCLQQRKTTELKSYKFFICLVRILSVGRRKVDNSINPSENRSSAPETQNAGPILPVPLQLIRGIHNRSA